MWRRASASLAITLAVWIGAGCGGADEQDAEARNDLPDEVIVSFVTEETDSGRLQWRLEAPEAKRFGARNVFIMTEPQIEFFDKQGALQTTLVSDTGEYLQDTHDMLAYGNVVVTSVEGDILETDTLRYLNEQDKIVSDSFVKLTRGKDVVTGYGLECDNTLSSVDIKRDVRARIVGDEEQEDG
jgi:LPS export ABC transporter protein LptC